jgi:hypothetical protein
MGSARRVGSARPLEQHFDLFLEDDPDFIIATDYANLVKVYQFWNLYELIEGELERLLDHALSKSWP